MWEMELKHDFVLTPNGNYRNYLHYLRPKVKVTATAAAEVTAIAGNQFCQKVVASKEYNGRPRGIDLPCLALLVARTDCQRAKQLGMQQKTLANN